MGGNYFLLRFESKILVVTLLFIHNSDSFHSIYLFRPPQSIVARRFPVLWSPHWLECPDFSPERPRVPRLNMPPIARTLEFVRYIAFTAWQTALFNPPCHNAVYTYRVDTCGFLVAASQTNVHPFPLCCRVHFWNEPNQTSCNYCVTILCDEKSRIPRPQAQRVPPQWKSGKVRMRGVFKSPEWLGRRLLPPCGRLSQL